MYPCVRAKRYKVGSLKGSQDPVVIQDAVRLLTQSWGECFRHDVSDHLLQLEMEALESDRSQIGQDEFSASIELRPMFGKSYAEFISSLSENEFCLSLVDVASRLVPTTILLPEQMIIVCFGSSCSVVHSTYEAIFLRGLSYTIIPTLTLCGVGGKRQIHLGIVDFGTNLVEACVPVGIVHRN